MSLSDSNTIPATALLPLGQQPIVIFRREESAESVFLPAKVRSTLFKARAIAAPSDL